MIKETSKAKFASPFRYVVYALLLALVVIALSTFAGIIRQALRIAHPEYLIYVVMLCLGIYAYFHYTTEYHYTLIDDELIIEKMRQSKRVDSQVIRTFNIVAYGTHGELGPLSPDERKMTRKYAAPNQPRFYIAVRSEWGRSIIVFSPSQKFIERFCQSMSHIQEKDII